MRNRTEWLTGVVAPLVFIAIILEADTIEGPKTAYVGVLSVVPMLAAVFGTPLMTTLVAGVTVASAYIYGLNASDGNVAAQNVRLIIITIVGLIAIGAAIARRRMQRALTEAIVSAARSEEIERQANTDWMTGLLNRRGLLEQLPVKATGPRSVIVLDCDRLKAINDNFGHGVGDEYVTAIAGRLRSGVSRRDLLARWGGDEFLVVLNTPAAEARTIAERLVARVSESPIGTSAGPINATVTGGLAEWAEGVALEDAVRHADNAMYEAKSQGGGALSVASSLG